MATLGLKLVLTPLLVGGASLVGRRFGPGVAGWLIGLPFTSGPIAFFLTLERGEAFGAAAASGILAGTISQAAFCLAYAWSAPRNRWPASLLLASIAFGVVTAGLDLVAPPLWLTTVAAITSLPASIALMPRQPSAIARARLPAWDLPARMVAATAFVLLLTEAAAVLGPYLTGLLAPYPLYATILAVFAHEQEGASAVARILRGLLFGLFAFVGFFVVLATTLERLGIAFAFLLALLVALLCQAASFRVAR